MGVGPSPMKRVLSWNPKTRYQTKIRRALLIFMSYIRLNCVSKPFLKILEN